MANPAGKLGFKLVTVAVSIPVGILARKGVEKVWFASVPMTRRLALGTRRQLDGRIGWAALSAVGIAAAELISLKGAAEVWRTLTGSEPPIEAGRSRLTKVVPGLEIFDQAPMRRLPAQQCSGQLARGRTIDTEESGQPGEVAAQHRERPTRPRYQGAAR